jgi:hypothetical protein
MPLSPQARNALFAKQARTFETTVNKLTFPTRITPAGTTVFRFVGNNPSRKLDYFDLFCQLPPGPDRGSRSSFNRWSGLRSDGVTPGVGGSYWGSTHGISAESFFYSCLRGYDPSVGPRRLLPSMTPLVVAGVQSRLPYHAEEGAPKVLPFSGNYDTNILIARTVRDIEVVDMDVTSARFQEWNYRVSRSMRAELDGLEFSDVAAAINDGEFKELSRLVSNVAYANAHEALVAKSVRQNSYSAPAYDPNEANNLVIFGRDREPFTDKLVGTGVIEIRPDPTAGAQATIKPVTVYPPKEERALVLAREAAPPASTGSAGEILAGATTPVASTEN